MPNIFLSHTHADKPLVEPVAIRLAEIFGKDEVFYDSWSIQPGDGIIDKMNQGLSAPEFVFFFVSAKSLDSGMVKLEWQNALHSASKGKTKVIPVRVDGSAMPAILTQNLYIDMHTHGLEPALSQIVGVVQGNATFTPQHLGFSNLTWSVAGDPNQKLDIVVRASHLYEPNPNFMLLVENAENEVGWNAPGAPGIFGGFSKDVRLNNGSVFNGIIIRPMNATLTPQHPVKLELTAKSGSVIKLAGILHNSSEQNWTSVPHSAP